MPIDPATQSKLFKEADARFAAQSGITRKLDPRNPADAKFVTAWTDIYNKCVRELGAGIIAWTYENPFVQTNLGAAELLADKSAEHLHAGVAATDPAEAAAHLKTSQDAHAASQQASKQAAAAQPPTISPSLAAEAARWVTDAIARGEHAVADAAEAVGAIQMAGASGMALGVHTPGDPNPLHFTMPGGAQAYPGPGGGGGAAPLKPKGNIALAAGIAAGAVGLGLLLASSTGKRSRGGGGRRRSSASSTYIIGGR